MGRRDRGWLQGGKTETDYSLSPIKNYGTLKVPGDYSPINIINWGNEWRDLWGTTSSSRMGSRPRHTAAQIWTSRSTALGGKSKAPMAAGVPAVRREQRKGGSEAVCQAGARHLHGVPYR